MKNLLCGSQSGGKPPFLTCYWVLDLEKGKVRKGGLPPLENDTGCGA